MTIPSRRRALLIHIEHYEDAGFAPLPSAHDGAEQLAEALRETAGVEVTVCADLTFGALRGAVARFCADREPDEFALLYLACRSAVAPAGEVVLAATDTDPHRLTETGLTVGALAACLEDCWAEQKVAVLDCPDPARSAPAPLPAPPGVYLLAGDPATESALVAGAMAEALRAGAQRRAVVTADDLFDAVALRLAGEQSPRTATVSAVRADGRIPVAAPPLPGGRPQPLAPDRRPTRPPDLRELLAYYRDVVRAGTGGLPLLDPAGAGHVLVHGRERVLLDDVDDDGCLPLPRGAEHVVADLRSPDRTLWAGWPMVVLHPSPGERRPGPLCAPLFVRRLEAVEGPDGPRLRPIGPPVPHLGLAHLRLGAEEATTLVASWVAGWRRGETARLVADADRLLRDELGLLCLERLRPELLGTRLNTHSPLDGARNVAVLFTAAPTPAVADLLADLDAIARTPEAVSGTALAALLPGTPAPELTAAPVSAVTPQALTATQQAVLDSVLTEPLTAVTGAAGTGKTRLVVDVVATAVAAGQSVLVAARTDRAVDEVVERCRKVLPGLLMRTGHRDGGDAEAGALDELLTLNAPRRSAETRRLGFRYAEHLVQIADQALRGVAEQETELLALGRARTAAYGRLGLTAEELTQRLGPDWGERARELATVRTFGEVRRRRFLGDTDLPPGPGRTAETCLALAELDELDRRWRAACAAARDTVPDAELQIALADARARMERASREVLAGVVLDGVDRGRPALAELRSVRRRGSPDRAAFHHALPHLRGWAVTALAARRLPARPGLFDLVVIDEAQHCPLPEALPLLFRARRALVIGDPDQLPHVDAVPARTDAVLRDRHAVARDWLSRHRLSPVRHSVLAAAERAAGGAAVLDEHYRSHPAIAELGNRLGPPRPLHVLTDIGRSPLPVRRAVMWRNVVGRAERGPDRTSWRNRAEADEAARCARRLLERLPPTATVGVVTPYRPQAEALADLLADERRVTVGTPSAFQGHEHEAMVLSMVADGTDHRFDRAQRQRELWTVALSRARYLLVVVGDEAVWTARGGFGAALVQAGRRATDLGRAVGDDLADRLDSLLSDVPGTSFEVAVRGHPADAVLHDGGHHRPVLIDRGADSGTDPAVHLARMLRLLDVLGDAAVRLPGWLLHDSPDAARTRIVV